MKSNKKSTPSSIHGGHRARMRKRFIDTKGTGFQSHEFLELLLYCTIPTKDVNPLAHQLIYHFGSLDAVLSASDEELRSVSGVGPKTSALIRSFNDICTHYGKYHRSGYRTIVNAPSAVLQARQRFPSNIKSEIIVLFENNNGTLLTTRNFPYRISDPEVKREILTVALALSVHSVILIVKNFCPLRPPRIDELKLIAEFIHTLSVTEIYTVDYIMLSGDHIFSFRQARLLDDESSNSLKDTLPPWYHWYAPLLAYPSESGWYCVPMNELEKLKKY